MSTLALPLSWDRVGLERVGFVGLMTFAEILRADIPPRPGIYVVLRTDTAAAEILESTVARAGSLYALDDLQGRWITGSPILYIGKSDAKSGGLRTRLRQYSRRGSSHQGGRSIWQLADHAELLVAWAETPAEIAEDLETSYRAAFADTFGGWPFANRKR